MSTSARKDLETLLQADWAGIPALAGVRVIATERQLGVPTKPTALIRQKTIKRLPELPQSHRGHGILVTLISVYEDFDKAADELDVLVPAALGYFDTRYEHDGATSVLFVDRLAYDIPLRIPVKKE